jgi:5-formyltetrahydrofolate cyclo-ligase
MLETKKNIRMGVLKKRRALSLIERQFASECIIQSIIQWNIFQLATYVALYHAFDGEVDLEELWKIACQLGKKTAFPVISKDKESNVMDFFEALPNDTEKINHFNIREPKSNLLSIPIATFDCLFIPLVAFDQQGYRLGMGKGYYDHALSKISRSSLSFSKRDSGDLPTHKPLCVGVAYDFQRVDVLPHEPWDIPMDLIVTEKQIYFFDDHREVDCGLSLYS